MAAPAILAIACLSGCGGTPRTPDHPQISAPVPSAHSAKGQPGPDPDLGRPPPRKLLAIDWSATSLATEADALALWEKIAPTGTDWEEKLAEVPVSAVRPLAVAMLRAGRFQCVAPPLPSASTPSASIASATTPSASTASASSDCAPLVIEVPDPDPSAGLGEPCLRRLLALWSLAQLEPEDLPAVQDALRAIAAIPPPESQLVDAALRAVPERETARLLSLIVIAARAGQRDLVGGAVARLSEAELIEAATKHHVEGALEVLSAQGHRGAYLAGVVDEDLAGPARLRAISDLVADADRTSGMLEPDLVAALAKAAAAKDCAVAAAAARALEQHGDRRFVPVRPRTRATGAAAEAAMMRALCVLASYEPLQRPEESSPLATYVAGKGLERVLIEYDALSDADLDGDGDPHTKHSVDILPRTELSLPEVDDLARAMKRCTGMTCRSVDREFRFAFRSSGGQLWLSKLEVVERPPCP
jgi:hypothetical protein